MDPPAALRRRRRFKLKAWPTEDWEHTPWGYRAIKHLAEKPVRKLARIHARGVENVPLEGGVILAANHQTWADPVVLEAIMTRPAFFLAKERLFRNPLMRAFLKANGQIKVDRERGGNEAAIRTAVELVDGGFVVGVFPEGTRSRYGEVKRGRMGIARIALRSGAPVVPVAMTTADLWPKHLRFPRFGNPVYVNVGAPMRFGAYANDEQDPKVLQSLTDDIMGEVERLLADAEAARERGDPWDE